MVYLSSKKEEVMVSISNSMNSSPVVCCCSKTDASERRKTQRIRFTMYGIWICLFGTSIKTCTSFHTTTTTFTFRSSRSSLFVVEPKERTDGTRRRVLEPPIGVNGGNSLDSFIVNASAESQATSDSAPEESYKENEEEYEEAKEERLERVAKADALLSRRNSHRPLVSNNEKTTSVGARRIGSASQARSGARSVSRLAEAVKKAASASTVQRKEEGNSDSAQYLPPSTRISKSLIQSTVESMLQTSATMGLFGDVQADQTLEVPLSKQIPPPGTILLQSERSTKLWRASDRISVRVATVADDLDIANLRLSVFSDFSPDMRRAFCSKSCQVLSSRRNRGATCIVATVPRYGSLMSSRPDIILGTAECSYHEFEGTSLGRRRLTESIVYITEVAVSPSARRKGIGQKLMQSIDELASIRGIETVFLHVDAANFAALSLYRRAGYSQVPSSDQMYHEFTKSLNLHDGATKGRNHYLLYKDLTNPTWLPETRKGTLGFEITV